jgi:hypothetical protein
MGPGEHSSKEPNGAPAAESSSVFLAEPDRRALANAVRRLEHPGFVSYLAYLVGVPIEKALDALSPRWSTAITGITKLALIKAYNGALLTLRHRQPTAAATRSHSLIVGLSGALGGTLGVASLAIELPISATIMLRSIADIARSQGENPQEEATRLACLEVFAMGGNQPLAQAADTGYYAMRSVLAKTVGDSGKYLAARGLSGPCSPALVRMLGAVSARFAAPVSQKMALQAVPAIGVIGGASINLAFIGYFQELAEAHFTVRRLERAYGKEIVRSAYAQIAAEDERVGDQYL